MVIDAMEILHTQKPYAFCIASSDADFTPLVMHLRANGKDVYGFGERKTPRPLVKACTEFLYLVRSIPAGSTAAPTVPSPPKLDANSANKPSSVGKKPLATNSALITALRAGVAAAAQKNGWAPMAVACSLLRNQSVNPEQWGAKTFSKLFEATGSFEIALGEKDQPFVADRRNQDRSPTPARERSNEAQGPGEAAAMAA